MILHLTRKEKFTKPFIDFIKQNFSIKNHLFLLVGGQKNKDFELDETSYIKVINNKKEFFKYFIEFNIKMYKADKIIIHGFSQPYSIIYLFFNPWLLKKTYWIIWGADLYGYLNKNKKVGEKIIDYMKNFCIKRIPYIIAYADGDYQKAVKWYKSKAKFLKCLYYPYFAVEDYLADIQFDVNSEEAIIMVGNSASVSCEHIEVFRRLKKIVGIEKYQILCPLSYGNKEYAKYVIEEGYKYFGKNFKPLVEFMQPKDYYKLLSKVEIVIMAHKRQQATGNILALIKFGKKIFIRSDISTWEFYKENGIKMYDYELLENELFIKQDENIKLNNQLAIKNNFTYSRIVKDWSNILDGDKKC
jgi:hypothetical protein